ncbi:MAG: hypothetical protein N2Z62_04940 [Rhodobacteraceae bacterium]|nr:hypothetical protein [Paracoccaceae bacterium]
MPHINDFHSRIEPMTASGSACDAETEAKGKRFGGAAGLCTRVNALRGAIRAEGGMSSRSTRATGSRARPCPRPFGAGPR